ncbi:MAG: hypothetical protein GF411_03700 [Candidatus Lokiarchaeota archaeon]|nr:hypothetical protein [Candidatus Lokiarchaeota archaeon]
MITEKQEEAILEFAFQIYESLDYTHGRSHAERTVTLALHLSQKESADIEIVRFGALLHQYHPERLGEVESFLRSIELESNLRKPILHCVECVEPETIRKAETIEAKVVFDADKLQTLGPFGLVREVCYRTNRDGISFEQAVRESEELQLTMYPLIQTDSGQRYAKELQTEQSSFFETFKAWDLLDFV